MPFCEAKLCLMFPSGTFSEDHPVVSGTHLRDCCVFNGGDLLSFYNWVGCLKQEEEFIKKLPNLSAEMTVKTEN
jgi:hypothetical protein